jgi:hypothetical protein
VSPVGVSAVIDSQHNDLVVLLIDAVHDPKGPAPGHPHAFEHGAGACDTVGAWSRSPVISAMAAAATASGRTLAMARPAGPATISS